MIPPASTSLHGSVARKSYLLMNVMLGGCEQAWEYRRKRFCYACFSSWRHSKELGNASFGLALSRQFRQVTKGRITRRSASPALQRRTTQWNSRGAAQEVQNQHHTHPPKTISTLELVKDILFGFAIWRHSKLFVHSSGW